MKMISGNTIKPDSLLQKLTETNDFIKKSKKTFLGTKFVRILLNKAKDNVLYFF